MLAKIDTIQASMLRTNILKIGELEEKSFIKEGSTKIIIDNDVEYITTVLHPSREDGRYSRDSNTYTYSYYKAKKKKMLTDLTVKVIDDVKVKRMDICFDLIDDFNEIYPMLELIAFCYCLEYKTKNAWKNIGLFDNQIKAIMNKARHNELCIYNKQSESNGLHPYNTRIEFRIKDIVASEEKKLKDLNTLLNRLYGNLKAVEAVKVDILYKQYIKEVTVGITHDFSEFVRHNSSHFCTRNVLEQLYKKVGMQGNFTNWFKYYKKNNSIILYSESQVKSFINEMKRSLISYKNS